MDEDEIRTLLRDFRDGEADEEQVLQRLVRQPYEEHLLGRFDHLREARKWLTIAERAEALEDDDLREELADLEETITTIETVREQVGSVTSELPGLREQLKNVEVDASDADQATIEA